MHTVSASEIAGHGKSCHSNLYSGYCGLILRQVSVIGFSFADGVLNNPRSAFPVPVLYCALAPAQYCVSAKSRSPMSALCHGGSHCASNVALAAVVSLRSVGVFVSTREPVSYAASRQVIEDCSGV